MPGRWNPTGVDRDVEPIPVEAIRVAEGGTTHPRIPQSGVSRPHGAPLSIGGE